VILHIVLYEPKPGLSADNEAEFRAFLLAAVGNIQEIRQVRIGRTVDLGIGYEARSEGQSFGYVAVFEFDSIDKLKAYMAHAAHVALAAQFWKHCDRTMILDVEAEDPTAGPKPGGSELRHE
jgi:hypothetical protein